MKPSPAGYSRTPLWKKLGIREGLRVLTINAPPDYIALLPGLPDGVRFVTRARPPVKFVHFFADSVAKLAWRLPGLARDLAADGVIWVSWPKKGPGVPTDITEDAIRKVALPLDLVDVKVCAVDATWSGLKLVIPKSKRRTA